MEGVDYSWGRPNIDQLWSLGYRFVSRYLAFLPNGKVLTKSELTALHRRGFGVCLNWEQAAGDMLRGYTTGQRHAHEAARQAGLLGAPPNVPVYFSCDTDARSASEIAAVGAYLDGAASVLGRSRIGLYGSYRVIEALVPSRAVYGWQTYAWSGGAVSGKAHFYQYRNGVSRGGADVDLNRTLKDPSMCGFWWPNAPQPQPQPPSEERNSQMSMFYIQNVGEGDPTIWRTDGWGHAIPLSKAHYDALAPLQLPYVGVANATMFREVSGEAYYDPDAAATLSQEATEKLAEAVVQAGGVLTAGQVRVIVDEESISPDEIGN